MSTSSEHSSDAFRRNGLDNQVHADERLREIGLEHLETEWRRQFVGFDHVDVCRLTPSQDIFAPHPEQLSNGYDEMTAHDFTLREYRYQPLRHSSSKNELER